MCPKTAKLSADTDPSLPPRQRQPSEVKTAAAAEAVPQIAAAPGGASGDFKSIGTAVVAGATGQTGKAILQRLVREGVPVKALVRDPSKAVSHMLLPGHT